MASKASLTTSSPRICGGCTLCCKLFAIEELVKPRDVWCRHVVLGKGCGLHPEWPDVCRDFFCLWRKEMAAVLPDALRPDRCGVVLTAAGGGKAIVAVCSPDKPFAWRDEMRVLGFLTACASQGISISVRSGKTYFVVGSRGYAEVPPSAIEGDVSANKEFVVKIPDSVRAKLGIGPDMQAPRALPTTGTANVVH